MSEGIDSARPAGELLRLDTAVPIGETHALPGPGDQKVMGGAHSFFRSADGQMDVGIWQGSPGMVSISAYPSDELWHIVSGTIIFTGEAGVPQAFGAGDSFVLPKGYSGTAEISGDFRKLYAMSPPLARKPA